MARHDDRALQVGQRVQEQHDSEPRAYVGVGRKLDHRKQRPEHKRELERFHGHATEVVSFRAGVF